MQSEQPSTDLATRFNAVRSQTIRLCEPLSAEDHGVQSMPDASPTKWHLAHTSWFFETFLLLPHLSGYTEFHPRFATCSTPIITPSASAYRVLREA